MINIFLPINRSISGLLTAGSVSVLGFFLKGEAVAEAGLFWEGRLTSISALQYTVVTRAAHSSRYSPVD